MSPANFLEIPPLPTGTYTKRVEHDLIEYSFDGRFARVESAPGEKPF